MLTSNVKLSAEPNISAKPKTKLGLATAMTAFWIAAIVAPPALAQSAPSSGAYQIHQERCGTNYERYCADSN